MAKFSIVALLLLALFVFGCAQIQTQENISSEPLSEVPQAPIEETPIDSESVSEPSSPSDNQEPAEHIIEQIPLEMPIEGVSSPTSEEAISLTESALNQSANQTKSGINQMSSDRCKDSDVAADFPDGFNLGMMGNITINGKGIINGIDYCPNVAMISEWYCDNGVPRVKTLRCPSGSCSKGVCVSLSSP